VSKASLADVWEGMLREVEEEARYETEGEEAKDVEEEGMEEEGRQGP